MSYLPLVTELGVEVVEVNRDEAMALCPGHLRRLGRRDRSIGSWSVNITTGEHKCFSCGFRGTFPWLVAFLLDLRTEDGLFDLARASGWVRERGLDIRNAEELEKFLSPVRELRTRPMSEARLGLYDPPPKWALDRRGIDADAAAELGLLWDERSEAWIAPIRDPESRKLWGWQLKGQGSRVFRNLPPAVKKSKTLFGIDAWPEVSTTAIVVEAPLDTARIASAGFLGALSTFGANLSTEQVQLLTGLTDELIIALDNPRVDDAGRKATMALIGRNSRGERRRDLRDVQVDFATVRFFNYADSTATDPGEMDDDEIERGVLDSLGLAEFRRWADA